MGKIGSERRIKTMRAGAAFRPERHDADIGAARQHLGDLSQAPRQEAIEGVKE